VEASFALSDFNFASFEPAFLTANLENAVADQNQPD
jgi:hypothetical protein